MLTYKEIKHNPYVKASDLILDMGSWLNTYKLIFCIYFYDDTWWWPLWTKHV
jgi:hypothetical protein